MDNATMFNKMDEALGETFFGGPGGLGNRITGIFQQMEVAEDEIDQAKKRHPAKAPILHEAFTTIRPCWDGCPRFDQYDPWLYRAYCRELLERIAAGQDTRPGTDVELLIASMEASMRAPLNNTGNLIHMRLFARVYQDKPGMSKQVMAEIVEARDNLERVVRGSEVDVEIAALRRKAAIKERKAPEYDQAGLGV